MGPINVNCAETIIQRNYLYSLFCGYILEQFEFVSEVNFSKSRHLGLQFKHKNETISIRNKLGMIFLSWLRRLS